MKRVVRVAINAVALLFAGLLVPGIEIAWSEEAEGIVITLLALAIVFGLINTFVRPLARLVSIPLNIATLGLFSVVLNAGLLLAVAFVVDLVWQPLIVIGGYPPDLSLQAVATAAIGAFIISAVSTALNVLIPDS
ncbi:MAG: phage holin family protein [Chloroflexota bacterium]